ncbi:MAG: T9SS type A sorting domain-containing protein [candidate division Zixibacteria bacterium]|nr:T9SS type A sorting domain-containing protein [candidate division Zixibacteria bacterium]
MRKRNFALIALLIIFTVLLTQFSPAGAQAIIADHNSVLEFESIPDSIINFISGNYRIYYAHTSHGSQIITGIDELQYENPLYDYPYFHEVADDLGGSGDTSWVPDVRNYLDSHPECNMAMFSWCGGVSDNTPQGINIYLNKMDELENDYPDVIFIYMTGHLDGTGPGGNLYERNNQIRAYCEDNSKILFDFADIESYDPDGNYYPYASDACEWCYDWCDIHDCPSCGCAHSHCFNCYMKGKSWWWMMARISGWGENPPPQLTIDMRPDNPPVITYPGGYFTYTGSIINESRNPVSTDVWIMLTIPSGGYYGPLSLYNGISVGAEQTITIPGIAQEIPSYAPLGIYNYHAYCGEYPSDKTDSSSFQFALVDPRVDTKKCWRTRGWSREEPEQMPASYSFLNCYPNPFNSSTTVKFALAESSDITLDIYNILGERVELLARGTYGGGIHEVNWNAARYSSGIYFVKLTSEMGTVANRAIIIK